MNVRQARLRTARGGAVAGSWLRILRLRTLHPGLTVGFDSFVGPGCEIRCPEGATIRLHRTVIGRGVLLDVAAGGSLVFEGGNYVGPHSVLVAREHIVFRPDAQVAEMTVIRDQDHVVGDGLRLTDLVWVAAGIELGARAQVCAKATVLKGVRIGADAVVAAGAVVTHDVPAATLVGGIPARTLRSLAPDLPAADPPGVHFA